ncbi:MAG: flagellar motor switch protein FliG [Alphaproteobacteria bacterium]
MAEKKSSEGPRKAAILLLSIGEERAAAVFSAMDDYEIRDISREMAAIGKISGQEVEETMTDFMDTVGGPSGGVVGGWNATERYLKSFLKEDRVSELMEEMRGPAGRTMWEKLANVAEDTLATYLQNEYPQTVAVILSRIKPAHAARVLSQFPEEFAMEIVQRIIVMGNVPREVLNAVEESLKSEFMRSLAQKNTANTYEQVAEIFNNFDRATEAKFIEKLEKVSPSDAEEIRALMFTFLDINKTDDKGLQAILRDVDKDVLTLALKGANEEMKSRFLKNMSERAAKILVEDMGAMGPVKVKDVEEAQMKVVTIAKDLADRGEIVFISEEGGDDAFIT